MYPFVTIFISSLLIIELCNGYTTCPNGYEACVQVTNNCGASLYLQRTALDGDEAWPINTPSESSSITTLDNGGSVVLDITAWAQYSGGQRLYAWWQDPTQKALDPMTYRDKVEINYGGANTMYYNPTAVDNFGLPLYIGPYNEADCQSGATTGFGSIKVSDIANECPYSYIYTPPFGVCQSPRLVCISDPTNSVCSQLDAIVAECIDNGDCAAGTTTSNVWACDGPMAQTPQWCSALHRGIYNLIKNGGNEADKSEYFKTTPYNEYAAFIHSRGAQHYAYPYDDYPSTLNEGGYIQCTNVRYMKVQFCPSDDASNAPDVPSTTTNSCGYIPPTCTDDLSWAVNTGSKAYPEVYPNFYDKTGVQLSETTEADMVVYWVCSDINPNNNCGGLQLPCGRSCAQTATTATTTTTTTTSTTKTTTTLSSGSSGTVFGMNIYATDYNFNIDMLEDMIVNKDVYNFRAFKSWGRTSAVINMLNQYVNLGVSLLFNIEWSEDCNSYVSIVSGYNFDVMIQIDSCGWPDCINPTEGGFCQGTMSSDVTPYINKLHECNSVFATDIEFVIPWQNADAHSSCNYAEVLQAARTIQNSNGRPFSLSGTFYNFFHGPSIGDGTFPTNNIDDTANIVQTEANNMANGLTLGLRLAETAWPDQCDNGADKGYGSASLIAMCKYYNEAIHYTPSETNTDVKIYWWIIDDRDVGDGCGDGAWGLYDASGNFKCPSDTTSITTTTTSSTSDTPSTIDAPTSITQSPVNAPTSGTSLPSPKPTSPIITSSFIATISSTTDRSCGYIPSSCVSDLSWALNTGSKEHPEWYPNFDDKTGVQLSETTEADMVVYWVCSGINPNNNCNDLKLPCDRNCGEHSSITAETTDYIGFDVSTGLQSDELSALRVGEITADLKGVKHYRFYGHNNDDEIARQIVAKSSFKDDLKFSIEILPEKVNNLSYDDIESLLSIWNDLKEYIYCIQLGNEPVYNGISFDILPSKLQMVYNYVKQRTEWQHVIVSIPFSASIFSVTYPVKDSVFKSEYKSSLKEILSILQEYNGVFSINLYPFFTAMYNPNLLQYCLGNEGDDTGTYDNILSAKYDATLYALNDLIFNNGIQVQISETGWATSGSSFSSTSNANQYISNTIASMDNPSSKLYKVRIFFFELFDEDLKSNGEWEKHFGFHNSFGSAKYSNLDILKDGVVLTRNDDKRGNMTLLIIICVALLCFIICLSICGYVKLRNYKRRKSYSFPAQTTKDNKVFTSQKEMQQIQEIEVAVSLEDEQDIINIDDNEEDGSYQHTQN